MVLLKNDKSTLPISRDGYPQDRRHRGDGELLAAGDEQPGPVQLHLERHQLQPRLHDQRPDRRRRVEPGVLRSGQERGPDRGHRRGRRRYHGQELRRPLQPRVQRRAPTSSSSSRASRPSDEGEEYTGAGDRTTGGINATNHSVDLVAGSEGRTPGSQNNLIKQRRRASGKPIDGRARGRRHHRHALVLERPGGGDGLVPGHGRAARRSAGCCSATSTSAASCRSPGTPRRATGRRSRAIQLRQRRRRWGTTSATSISTRTGRP